MPLYGALDIGSNTLICSVIEEIDGKFKTLKETIYEAGPEWSLDQGEITYRGCCFLDKVAEDFLNLQYRLGLRQVFAAGTSLFRASTNGARVLSDLYNKTNWDIQLLTGEAEARYAHLAVSTYYENPELVLIDLGGRSTELAKKDAYLSISSGAKALLEEGAGQPLRKIKTNARKHLPELKRWPHSEAWYWVGGTAAALAMIHLHEKVFIREHIEGLYIETSQIEEWVLKLDGFSLEERVHITGLSMNRCQMLVPGLVLLEALLHKYKVPGVKISTLGFRQGLVIGGVCAHQ